MKNYVTYDVHMLAFKDRHVIRKVSVPEDARYKDTKALLSAIWTYGQNDFQPQPLCSVSAGDVINLNGEYWLIKSEGFQKLTSSQFDRYSEMNLEERWFVYFPENGINRISTLENRYNR